MNQRMDGWKDWFIHPHHPWVSSISHELENHFLSSFFSFPVFCDPLLGRLDVFVLFRNSKLRDVGASAGRTAVGGAGQSQRLPLYHSFSDLRESIHPSVECFCLSALPAIHR